MDLGSSREPSSFDFHQEINHTSSPTRVYVSDGHRRTRPENASLDRLTTWGSPTTPSAAQPTAEFQMPVVDVRKYQSMKPVNYESDKENRHASAGPAPYTESRNTSKNRSYPRESILADRTGKGEPKDYHPRSNPDSQSPTDEDRSRPLRRRRASEMLSRSYSSNCQGATNTLQCVGQRGHSFAATPSPNLYSSDEARLARRAARSVISHEAAQANVSSVKHALTRGQLSPGQQRQRHNQPPPVQSTRSVPNMRYGYLSKNTDDAAIPAVPSLPAQHSISSVISARSETNFPRRTRDGEGLDQLENPPVRDAGNKAQSSTVHRQAQSDPLATSVSRRTTHTATSTYNELQVVPELAHLVEDATALQAKERSKETREQDRVSHYRKHCQKSKSEMHLSSRSRRHAAEALSAATLNDATCEIQQKPQLSWATDRSPLLRLECTLLEISKVKMRARVQEAEMLL